jgi:acetylcholinesterase
MSALAIFLSISTLLLASGCAGVLAISDTGPVITLSYGSFQGNLTGDVVEFLGIPFAAPPYASYLFFSTILKRPFF